MNLARRGLRALFKPFERAGDAIFGTDHNPLKQLGALGFFFTWIVIATGVHVYIGFDTAVAGAYGSVEMISRSPWFLAGLSRSLHRYASDALVLVMLLHLAREFSLDRYRGVRWFSWLIGVPIMVFVYVSGITGYWLVWDTLAQYVAVASTEWLDWLPIFGEPVARNFLAAVSLDDRFFTLLIYLHIAIPLALVFMLWIHLQRISRPRINPPRQMALAAGGMLVALSVVFPAASQAPADLAQVPARLRIDWFYLPFYPLIDHVPPGLLWMASASTLLLMILLPWLPPLRRPAAAAVLGEQCNGCTRCVDDCPYAAITMVRRSDGRPFEQQAQVNPSLCVGCGICVAACPPSTPFRGAVDLRTGIDLPDMSLRALREATWAAASRCAGASSRVMLFGCQHGAARQPVEGEGFAQVTLPCIGMLPPSFIDYVLSRDLADGVLLVGCAADDCYHRFGVRWTEERIAGRRDPRMRARVPRERVATLWAGPAGAGDVVRQLTGFRAALAALPAPPAAMAQGVRTPDVKAREPAS